MSENEKSGLDLEALEAETRARVEAEVLDNVVAALSERADQLRGDVEPPRRAARGTGSPEASASSDKYRPDNYRTPQELRAEVHRLCLLKPRTLAELRELLPDESPHRISQTLSDLKKSRPKIRNLGTRGRGLWHMPERKPRGSS